MNFVDEQHIVLLQVRENCRQVTFDLNHRTRSLFQADAQLIGDHRRQRRLSQPRRAVKKHMVHGLAARTRGRDSNRQVVLHLLLPDVFLEKLGPQAQLKRLLVLKTAARNDAFFHGDHVTQTESGLRARDRSNS